MNNIELQTATRSFFKTLKWTDPVAVTLTFKNATMANGHLIFAKEEDYRKNVRHFLNILNKTIYRSLARKGWLLNVAAVKETGEFGRDHYHLIIDKPPHLRFEAYAALIQTAWNKTIWGHRKIEVSRDGSERWINYVTKLRSKPNYADAIDWTNTHKGAIPLSEIHLPFRLRMMDTRTDQLFALAAPYK